VGARRGAVWICLIFSTSASSVTSRILGPKRARIDSLRTLVGPLGRTAAQHGRELFGLSSQHRSSADDCAEVADHDAVVRHWRSHTRAQPGVFTPQPRRRGPIALCGLFALAMAGTRPRNQLPKFDSPITDERATDAMLRTESNTKTTAPASLPSGTTIAIGPVLFLHYRHTNFSIDVTGQRAGGFRVGSTFLRGRTVRRTMPLGSCSATHGSCRAFREPDTARCRRASCERRRGRPHWPAATS